MNDLSVRTLSVKQLRSLFARKIFAVPEIQREFVWTAKKACALLDSIYQGLPIGTTMIWETPSSNRNLLRRQYHILPSCDDIHNKNIWYLIDGQQRLSVIYQVFESKSIVNARGVEINFDNIFFSLDDQFDSIFEYLRRPDPDRHFRVSEILKDNWKRFFKKLPRYKLERIADCRNRILSYKFPMLIVHTKQISDVRETFIRINTRGMAVSAADRAFARATKVRLRDLVRDLKNSLNLGFNNLPEENILQAVALAFNANDVGERAIQSTIKELETNPKGQDQFEREWPKLKSAIQKTVDYLTTTGFGILNYEFLPSQNMITTLSLFFYYNNGAQPSLSQKREIKKWFWATAVGQRYTGQGFRRNILDDVVFFQRLGTRKPVRFRIPELVPISDLVRADYGKRSVVSNSFFCMLALNRPHYIKADGEIPKLNYSARANRSDKHHIFPRDLLKRHGISRRDYDSIVNICILTAEENQSFGNKAPHQYLGPYKKKRWFAQSLKSHLIPHQRSSPLWESTDILIIC